MATGTIDYIIPEVAHTLAGLFEERVRRTPGATAYRYFDKTSNTWKDLSWHEMEAHVARWRAALAQESLQPGDRVALILRNCPQWVMFDQAALGLGLVVVPLYVNDRAENIAYILHDAGVKLLLIQDADHWRLLQPVREQLSGLLRILALHSVGEEHPDSRLCEIDEWLPQKGEAPLLHSANTDDLATIVYTSGTTGRPKGVMLSHGNILCNAHAVLQTMQGYREEVFLSFLPLSHTFERTVGYYLPIMAGTTVAYVRSTAKLMEDLVLVRPAVLLSVPRIFERAYGKLQSRFEGRRAMQWLFELTVSIGWRRFLYQQGRGNWRFSFLLWPLLDRLVARKVIASLGGRIRIASCGAAPLSPTIAKVFIALGLPLVQGYGLTEASPVVSANPLTDNDPNSAGVPLAGVKVRIGPDDELLVKGPSVMLGYWHNPGRTAETINDEGWLHTGDQARIENGHIYITGRLKEIIVLTNGEKVPPEELETAIALDPLFDQVITVGEGRPYLSTIAVLDPAQWQRLAHELEVDPSDPASLKRAAVREAVLRRMAQQLRSFPGYTHIRRVALTLEPWTIENGLLTPTLKLRRSRVLKRFSAEVAALYLEH